jgi:hypothetical protein
MSLFITAIQARAARKVYAREERGEAASGRWRNREERALGGVVGLAAEESTEDWRNLCSEQSRGDNADIAQPDEIDSSSDTPLRSNVAEDEDQKEAPGIDAEIAGDEVGDEEEKSPEQRTQDEESEPTLPMEEFGGWTE